MEQSPEQNLVFQLGLFTRARKALDAALADDEGDVKSRNSLLLSYVFTFEMAIKSLRASLTVRGLNTPDYAAAVLKTAFRAQLVDDPAMWEQLKDHRNDVNHAYDESKAIVIAAFVHEQASACFSRLAQRLEYDG